MKESIMSFYNAPITNQVPNGVVSIDQLYTCRAGRRETVQAVEAKPAALCHARRGILLPKGGPVAFSLG